MTLALSSLINASRTREREREKERLLENKSNGRIGKHVCRGEKERERERKSEKKW